MNKRVKRKWLKALRSGQYWQGIDQLVNCSPNKDSFCCLGVLTNLYCEERNLDFESRANVLDVAAPEVVSRWADIPEWDGSADGSTQAILAGMNDGFPPDIVVRSGEAKRKSFKQIANWIEKNL